MIKSTSSAQELVVLKTSQQCSFYELPQTDPQGIYRYLVSTPESRAICNDPSIVGVKYTRDLTTASAAVLRVLRKISPLPLEENHSIVFHILRGGLNFGLREALHEAYDWNIHGSAFISAQRVRRSDNPEEWYITEDKYNKVVLPTSATIIFADVVATGTSLGHALQQLVSVVEQQRAEVRQILFFTIGSPRAEQLLTEMHQTCKARFPAYQGATVVYFEGRFAVALPESKLRIKITGTDLLRSPADLAPEFLNSQYDNFAYPLERCVIYDAGSRAFSVEEYLADVKDYWQEMLKVAQGGATYQQVLEERFPGLDPAPFKRTDLVKVCQQQLAKLA